MQKQTNSILDEPRFTNENDNNVLLQTHQTGDDKNEELQSDSINQQRLSKVSLVNERQSIDDDPMLAEQIDGLQLKDCTGTNSHHLDEARHYTSYFYQQTDFIDYTNSTMAPRAPTLFSGKKFIS